jgi:hypothetical protein
VVAVLPSPKSQLHVLTLPSESVLVSVKSMARPEVLNVKAAVGGTWRRGGCPEELVDSVAIRITEEKGRPDAIDRGDLEFCTNFRGLLRRTVGIEVESSTATR